MMTSELVTFFSQSLLSNTVVITEVLKVEGADQCEGGEESLGKLSCT